MVSKGEGSVRFKAKPGPVYQSVDWGKECEAARQAGTGLVHILDSNSSS